MRKTFLLGATALAAVAVVQWLPASAQAADAIPTVCLTNPAPTGPKGETGPPGQAGPPGPQGPPASFVPGPSRQPHPAEVEAPQCDDIEGICIVKLPGEQGPIGEPGPQGDPGPMGPPGGQVGGPSRAPHTLRGDDPCQGVPTECEITIVGPTGPQGDIGPKGPDGPPGPPGDFLVGPARVAHSEIVILQVEVAIPALCQDYLESLVPVPTTAAPTTTGVGSGGGELPATGNSDSMALAAAALVAIGGAVLLVRRRAAV